jgi:hypothetical protein
MAFDIRDCRERKHVGRRVLPPKLPIESLELPAAGQQNVHFASKSRGSLRTRGKSDQPALAQTRNPLSEYHHSPGRHPASKSKQEGPG